jgi:hypothetical protein
MTSREDRAGMSLIARGYGNLLELGHVLGVGMGSRELWPCYIRSWRFEDRIVGVFILNIGIS